MVNIWLIMVSIAMGVPQNRWLIVENPRKWRMTGGTPMDWKPPYRKMVDISSHLSIKHRDLTWFDH